MDSSEEFIDSGIGNRVAKIVKSLGWEELRQVRKLFNSIGSAIDEDEEVRFEKGKK